VHVTEQSEGHLHVFCYFLNFFKIAENLKTGFQEIPNDVASIPQNTAFILRHPFTRSIVLNNYEL